MPQRERTRWHISNLAVEGDNWKSMLPLILVFAVLFLTAAVIVTLYFLAFKKEQPVEKVYDEDDDGENKKTLDNPPEEYQNFTLDEHNRLRKVHHANELKFRPLLMKKAQKCCEYYLQKGVADHTCPHKNNPKLLGTNFGENLYMTNHSSDALHCAKTALDGWYKESENYDFKLGESNVEGAEISHFSQLIWKATKEIGVWFKTKDKLSVFTCLYNPVGNQKDKYERNVLPE